MSGGEGGFLSRWSRLKREDESSRQGEAAAGAPAGPRPSEEPVDQGAGPSAEKPSLEDLIESLPKLETLAPGQDLSAFMQAWVPADLRHAALRRMWLVDPAIRDYVSPALDYAYDYNNPSSIAGFGPMQTTAEQIREVMDMFDRAVGEGARGDTDKTATKVVEVSPEAPASEVEEAAGSRTDAAPHEAVPEPARPVRSDLAGFAGRTDTGESDTPESRSRDAAPQEKNADASEASGRRRRHGGALPG